MILAAARFGDIDTLEDCITKGAEVNCQDHNVSNIVYRTHITIINIKIVYLYKVKNIKLLPEFCTLVVFHYFLSAF
jgi:hypothetical protein